MWGRISYKFICSHGVTKSYMKKCCRCKETKEFSAFNKRSRNRDGFEFFCKACSKLENDANREKRREYDRKNYYKNQKEKIAKSSRWGYIKRGNPIPEKYLATPKPETPKPKDYQSVLDRLRIYKANNKEKYKKVYQLWANTEKGKLLNRIKSNRYRVRKRALINDLTSEDVNFLFDFQKGQCGCCKKKFTETVKYEIDHIVPVSKDGPTTLSNSQLLCVSCNRSKKDKIIRYIPEIINSNMSFGEH